MCHSLDSALPKGVRSHTNTIRQILYLLLLVLGVSVKVHPLQAVVQVGCDGLPRDCTKGAGNTLPRMPLRECRRQCSSSCAHCGKHGDDRQTPALADDGNAVPSRQAKVRTDGVDDVLRGVFSTGIAHLAASATLIEQRQLSEP